MRLQTPLLTTASTLAALAHAAAVPSAITTSEPLSDLIGEAAHNISARTINPAVRFTEYEGRQCGGWEAYYQAPDDGCYLLPTGDGFRIREIADSCRSLFFSLFSLPYPPCRVNCVRPFSC
jgi:hypothetical protein